LSIGEITDVSLPLSVGDVRLANRVFLAPMSGVTDTPFRALAQRLGAGAVVSEMVASSEWVRGKRKAMEKAARGEARPFILQLAGRDAYWMAEAARLAEATGADIIDINMGCPAREVTGMLSGSALMRDLDHASGLIAAVVNAVKVPVTLKMRLGWDDTQRNAPELARRAESLGVKLLTVHGRTRCQFYKGAADWRAIADVKAVTTLPVVANGDIATFEDARRALKASGADAVMVGRAAYGAPWAPGVIAKSFAAGAPLAPPSLREQADLMIELTEGMAARYGEPHGVRLTRKHLGWLLDRASLLEAERKGLRRQLCTASTVSAVRRGLMMLTSRADDMEPLAA
jgi:tRNA-dihydrouridine synthase B